MSPSPRRTSRAVAASSVVVALLGVGCGGSRASAFGPENDGGDGDAERGKDGGSSHPLGDSGGVHFGSDSGAPDTGPAMDANPPPAVVYAESPGTLYKLDPATNAISIVGPFKGACEMHGDCSDMIDIALDQDSNGYGTTETGLYAFDPTTAITTLIAQGDYPNSLSFVPKGTLDPSAEALVGYDGADYVRIDTTTGKKTSVGSLTGGFSSSGDIVSVIGGGSFLTVTGPGCDTNNCLLQVDPTTGDLIQNYGSVNHQEVYGIAFWAGTVYGFDNAGVVFSMTFPMGKLVTTDIPVPMAPKNLQFYGAGSTTSAPPKESDGGGIPIK